MYEGMTQANQTPDSGITIVDLRSDTVTQPSEGMRAAMAAAIVGDDVYGEDPTVAALEEKGAALLGKQTALFFPSGTQSNLAALLTHCGRGEEYIAGDRYHVYTSEAGGAAVLGGIMPCPIATQADGGLDPEAVRAAIKPDDPHYPVTRLLCLENSVSGKVLSPDRIAGPAAVAAKAGLRVHLDGARLFNAAVALNIQASELAAPADSVSICLSKGLGAPAGTLLVGAEDFIAAARRQRKILGGALRQVGVLAACGLYALENNIQRLAEDHRRAALLAGALAQFDGLEVQRQAAPSNMVFITPRTEDHAALTLYLRDKGILIGGQRPTIRLVLHKDIDDDGLERCCAAFRQFYRYR